jgi:hypothetical protein
MFIRWSFTNFEFLIGAEIPPLVFNMESYGKMNKHIFLEITNMIEPKLYINLHCPLQLKMVDVMLVPAEKTKSKERLK